MKRFHYRFRVMLLTLALGLASVPFFNSLSETWNEIPVELPEIKSESPIYVFPEQVLTEYNIHETELINRTRDLSLYNFGGRSSNCGFILLSEVRKCEIEERKSRDFIWKNWQAKKRAYLFYKWTGIDAGVEYEIFIEPNENGDWQISMIGYRWGMHPYQGKLVKDVRQVKRKRATEDDHRFEKGTVYLSFLDKDGNEVGVR